MATVRDYMNSQLVYLREGDRVGIALRPMLDFGITAVPILDEEGCPTGVVSMRDLLDEQRPADRARHAPIIIQEDASIEDAARVLAGEFVHHVVVVNAGGRAVGILSALDVIRALLALSPAHPSAVESFERHARVAP